MRKSILMLLAAMLLLPVTLAAEQPQMSVDRLYEQLDEMIRGKDGYDNVYQSRIDNLKGMVKQSHDPAELSRVYTLIFDKYKTFDSDSARLYGHKALDMALLAGDSVHADRLRIALSYTYAAIGLFDNATEQIAKVDYESLPVNDKVDFLGQMVYLDTHMEQFNQIAPQGALLPDTSKAYLETIMEMVTPAHPEYYYYVAYEALAKDESTIRNALSRVEPELARIDYSSQHDAKLAWVVSQLYKRLGDSENHQRYLAMSAIADMNASNREIASLEELAQILQQQGDLQRAYEYISHCQRCAELYKNRVRALRVASLQNSIIHQYQRDLEKLQQRQRTFTFVLLTLLLILIGTVVYILVQRNRLKKHNVLLNSSNNSINTRLLKLSEEYAHVVNNNERTAEQIEQMRATISDLQSGDSAKVRSIGEMLIAGAERIDSIEQFRHRIVSLIKNSDTQTAMDICRSQDVTHELMKEFLTTFDTIFMGIFPDFIERFNELLRPDEQIVLKKDGVMSTDLRIFALVRLGINDSMTIAKVLRCSVQTVYNHRQQMRNKAVNRDRFDEQVQAIK